MRTEPSTKATLLHARGLLSTLLLLLPLALVLLCSCTGGSCRSHSDCTGGEACLGPNAPQVCGIPPREQCATDGDCGDGMRCHAVDDPCSPDGIGSECRPPCSASGCGEGSLCNADGACERIPCDEAGATECAPHEVCDPSRIDATTPVYDRNGGCAVVTCAGDADCLGGLVCVTGTCQQSAGTCVTPMAVP